MRQAIIPSYLYQQYKDDPDLVPFVAAFNDMAQEYLDWFRLLDLPIYTNAQCSGAMLDWVGAGIYGIPRPNLSSGNVQKAGQLNTQKFDVAQFNATVSNSTVQNIATTDDIYKRILTWNLYRGDGFTFNTRWLKRRVARFLFGANGADVSITDTNQISVIISTGNLVTIRYLTSTIVPIAGELNTYQANAIQFGGTLQSITGLPGVTGIDVLAAAMNAGCLDLPFQYTFTIVQG